MTPDGVLMVDETSFIKIVVIRWECSASTAARLVMPDGMEFAAKPQLAQRMMKRAVAAEVPFAWIAGDDVLSPCG